MRVAILVGALVPLVAAMRADLRAEDPARVRQLLSRLEQNSDVSDRQEAFRELNNLGPEAKEAVPVLINALRGTNADVRQIATNVLGKIGRTAVPELTKALKDENPM